jgi:CPA2 family monovalent cation:H+ antiporter-2
MFHVAEASVDLSLAFIELGLVMVVLAMLARLAGKWRFSAIPFYLLAGLAFGNGGIAPIRFSGEIVRFGSEIGVVLLLFTLGLEYTGRELASALQGGLRGSLVDLVLNFTPGLAAGYILGLPPLATFLLAGITYISSSSVVAKVLGDLGRMREPETPVVLSLLVLEDLAMALYLPAASVLLSGKSFEEGLSSVALALVAVLTILYIAIRHGRAVGLVVTTHSDEALLLTVLGVVLLVAGLAEQVHISAGVGAFLVGVSLTGTVSRRTLRLMEPLRDLFAAIFFLFFGLQIDSSALPPVILPAVVLALVTMLTKLATGWIVAAKAGIAPSGRIRAGAALVARGEFSIVIAGLGTAAGLSGRIGPLAAAYVLITAILGPVLVRVTSATRHGAHSHGEVDEESTV